MIENRQAVSKKDYSFGLLFFRRFYAVQKILFSRQKYPSLLLFFALVAFCGIEQFLAYKIGFLSGQFYKVLEDTDKDNFIHLVIISLVLVMSMAITKSIRVYISKTLIVTWRKKLTKALHHVYFTGDTFYQSVVMGLGGMDNPDQRMTADVDTMTKLYGSVIADLIVIPPLIVYYTYSAYTRAGTLAPISMFALFLCSSILNKLLMSPVTAIMVKLEAMEGNFRYKHVQLRTNAEALAFMDEPSVKVELDNTERKLDTLCTVQQTLYTKQLFLDLATNSFDYLGSIASYIVIGIPILKGYYSNLTPAEVAQVISQNSFVSMYLIYQFSKLVDMAANISKIAGVTHRISEILELKNTNNNNLKGVNNILFSLKSMDESSSDSTHNGLPVLSIKNLELRDPNKQKIMISGLTLDIRQGENLLITGDSSSGKTSLVRCMKGLWHETCGSKKISKSAYYIPQKPFVSDGTLRELIVSPSPVLYTADETEWITSHLIEFGLSNLYKRMGQNIDDNSKGWIESLSPGEMQLISFIRMFYHNPSFIILDEATSALSVAFEEKLYQKCISKKMTIVSVGHRKTLYKFHQKLLVLGMDEQGGWQLSDILPDELSFVQY